MPLLTNITEIPPLTLLAGLAETETNKSIFQLLYFFPPSKHYTLLTFAFKTMKD